MAREPRGEIVEPHPASLVESLRAVGYTLPAAVADLVDNSISAGSTEIAIDACWDGQQSHLAISDNGVGMDTRAIVDGMRLGTRNPLAERDAKDLGRFGLGLKTASFSQCRRLTVASKRKGHGLVIRRWDLDTIAQRDEWRLLQGAAPGSENLATVRGPHGTTVLWEALDRVVGQARSNDGKARDRFLQQLKYIQQHLAVVFHRFLSGRGAISITFNTNAIEGWDPFLTDEPATQQLPQETVGRGVRAVSVNAFVLPHSSRLSAAKHRTAGGPSGWSAQQGFYIYRNNRLLVAGDWLGLGMQKEEHYKLARISIELPNSLDLEWAIDVKKSRARPPEHWRDDFRRIAEATRTRAAEVYRHRGKVLARSAGSADLLWHRKTTAGKVTYVINRDHPLLLEVLKALGSKSAGAGALLRLLEETVPVHTILIDGAERPEAHAAAFETDAGDLASTATAVFNALKGGGQLSNHDALQKTLGMEPFNRHISVVTAALEAVITGGKRK